MISGYIIVWFFVFTLAILVIKNKGYKDIIISIHSQIRDFIKGKREHWISSKQEAVINKFINSNPPSQDERLWENGKPYKKRG